MRRILLLLALLAAAPLATGQTVWLSYCFDPGEGANGGTQNQSRHRIYWVGSSGPNYNSAVVGNDPVTFFAECPQGTKVDYWLYGSQDLVRAKDSSVKCGAGQSSFTVGYTDGATYWLGASFDFVKYSVTFAPNGGSGSTMSQLSGIVYTNSFPLLGNTYTKTGYTFSGWKDSRGVSFADGQGISSGSDFGVVDDGANVVLTAQWTPYAYTVTLYTNSVQFAATSVTYDSTYGDLPMPSLTGYTFAGWYTAENGGTKVESTTKVSITDNQALYAHWTPNTYKVTFDANGGSVSTLSGDVTYDSKYGTLPMPSNTGYQFDGWWTDRNDGMLISEGAVVSMAFNHTLYAHWTAMQYTVNFNANAMGVEVSPSSKSVTYGQQYAYLPTPSRTGYDFVGWFTSDSGGTQVTAESVYAPKSNPGTHYLYAHWAAKQYRVDFDVNGGTTPVASANVSYDSTYGELPTPTRTGYTFAGWWTDASGGTQIAPSTKVSITDTQTLYAHWTANTYAVTLDWRYGTGGSSSVTATYDSGMPAATMPQRPGYAFGGYYTEMNGGGTQYYNADGTSANNWGIASATTLYAYWILLDPATVRFVSNEGSGTMADTNILCSISSALPQNTFERTGYTFLHWTNSVGEVYADGAIVELADSYSAQTVVFGAVWAPNEYAVVFYPNGGKGSMANQVFHYDAPQNLSPMAFEVPNPGADFWDFVGWTNVATGAFYESGATVSNLTTEANGVVALTAVWGSKLSELSQALDCYNLNWTNYVTGSAMSNWAVCLGEGDGSESCVTNAWSTNLLLANITTNGVLSFSCKCTGASAGQIAIYQPTNPSGNINNNDVLTNIEIKADGEWHSFSNLYIECREGGFLAFHNRTTPYSTKYIDQVKWVPEGAEEDPTTISIDRGGTTYPEVRTASPDEWLTLSAPSRERYEFCGWTLSGHDASTAYYSVDDGPSESAVADIPVAADGSVKLVGLKAASDAPVSITARWKELPNVTIRFMANGGLGSMAGTNVLCGVDAELPSNRFVRDGYVFAGWAEIPNGGKLWGDRQVVSFVGETRSVDVYAVWLEPGCYGIAFDPGVEAAAWSMDYQCIASGKVANLSPCAFAAPAGKRFAGWRRADDGRRYDDGILVFNLADDAGQVVVFTALWENAGE